MCCITKDLPIDRAVGQISHGRCRFVIAGVLLSFALASGVRAQSKNLAPPALRAADTSSPRSTLHTFLDACNEYFKYVAEHGVSINAVELRRTTGVRILKCLDLSKLAPAVRDSAGAEAAIALKEVFDRIDMPADFAVPGTDQAAGKDGAPPLQQWRIPGTDIAIVRIAEGARIGEYLFSADTVAQAVDYYQAVQDLPYKSSTATPHFFDWYRTSPGWMIPAQWVRALPPVMQRTVIGVTVWQWCATLLVMVLGAVTMKVGYRVGRRVMEGDRRLRFVRYGLSAAFPIAAMFVPLFVDYMVSNQIRITGEVRTVIAYSMNILFLLAAIVVVMELGNRVAGWLISAPHIHPRGVDAHLIRLGLRTLSLVVAVVLFLEGGRQLGIPITTLLAGAGVGGLAFALAAQDTVKNFLGSVMLLLDKPFRVGDRVKVQQYDGFVTEIGLRSTRLRLLTGHLVTLPNEQMSRSDIENISKRPHIRRTASIRIPYDTPAAKVEEAVNIVRAALANHDGMDAAYPPRVYLNEFNSDSLNLLMIYWFHPPQYWDYLAFSQRLNLQIMRAFEEAGIRFALPTTTTFVASDPTHPGSWSAEPRA